MEKNKLLFALAFMMLLLGANTFVLAMPAEQEEARQIALRKMEQILRQNVPYQDIPYRDIPGAINDNSNLDSAMSSNRCVAPKDKEDAYELHVFVSSKMGQEMLLAYSRELKKYGGNLVLRGLPGGSFRMLAEFVGKMQESDPEFSMQIDDNLFETFGISRVPAIVLIMSNDCYMQENCLPRFDKVSGAVSVRLALEQMVKNGDLQALAAQILKEGALHAE